VSAALPGVSLVVSRSEAGPGGRRLTDGELAALGVRLVLHPLAAVLAALRAASMTYRAIADDGNAERVDRLPLAAFPDFLPPPERRVAYGDPGTVLAPAERRAAAGEPGINKIDT